MQDNGGEWVSRNAPLFNRKGTVWEGGIRVPAILRWPGHLPTGKVSGQVGIVQDVTASILAATGTTVPPSARPDGINLLPMLDGRSPLVERTLFFRFTVGNVKQLAVREGSCRLPRETRTARACRGCTNRAASSSLRLRGGTW